jgi:hypothetical protein
MWRYMSFSRFAWLPRKKWLWLSRADRLGDPWAISLAGDQLQHVISRHPITPIGSQREKKQYRGPRGSSNNGGRTRLLIAGISRIMNRVPYGASTAAPLMELLYKPRLASSGSPLANFPSTR